MAIPQEGTNQTQIVDVSSSGLCMESNQEFLAGEEIAIRVNKLVTFGVVRYCRELRPGWFSTGVHVNDIVAYPTQVSAGLAELLASRKPVNPPTSLARTATVKAFSSEPRQSRSLCSFAQQIQRGASAGAPETEKYCRNFFLLASGWGARASTRLAANCV